MKAFFTEPERYKQTYKNQFHVEFYRQEKRQNV